MEDEKKHVEENTEFALLDALPFPDMEGKVIQHRVVDDLDMHQHYEHIQNPKKHIEPRGCWRKCPKYKNIILLDHYGAAGLNDRIWIFNQAVQLAGYLCATVRVPPPRTMVSSCSFSLRLYPLHFLILLFALSILSK